MSALIILTSVLGCFVAARRLAYWTTDALVRTTSRSARYRIANAAAACITAAAVTYSWQLDGWHEVTPAVAQARIAPSRLTAADDDTMARLRTYVDRFGATSSPAPMTPIPQDRPPAGLPDVATMIDRLAARLEANGDDANGWRTLGWAHFVTGEFGASVKAYRRAIELRPSDLDIKSSAAQAMIEAAAGKVELDARAMIDAVLAVAPGHPRARFQKGLAREQDGDTKGAIEDWNAALSEPGDDAEWDGQVRQRIAAATARLAPGAGAIAPAAAPPTARE